MITLSQETTTLAEGATVTILRGHHPKTGLVGTYLVAARERNELRMRVDDVAPGSLRSYLELTVKWIQRERSKLSEAPTIPMRSPDNLKDFVHNMAQAGMFIFSAISDVDTTGNKRISRSSSKVSRHKGRKSDQSHTG